MSLDSETKVPHKKVNYVIETLYRIFDVEDKTGTEFLPPVGRDPDQKIIDAIDTFLYEDQSSDFLMGLSVHFSHISSPRGNTAE